MDNRKKLNEKIGLRGILMLIIFEMPPHVNASGWKFEILISDGCNKSVYFIHLIKAVSS